MADESVTHVQGFCRVLVNAYRVLDQRTHVVRPLVSNDEVKKGLQAKLNKNDGAHAYNQLVPWLVQDVARDSVRVFLDDDSRTASFLNIFRKARHPPVLKALRDHFRSIPSRWHKGEPVVEGLDQVQAERVIKRWAEEDRKEFEESFEEGWKVVEASAVNLERDPVGQKMLTLRNKYLSHLEMTPFGTDPVPFDVGGLGLVYSDILAFPEKYRTAVFELVRICTGTVYAAVEYKEIHSRQGTDFWSRLSV
jgi:hypothetical protein